MANNRMFLRCDYCGAFSPSFCKYYPSTGWYLLSSSRSNVDLEQEQPLTVWLQAHAHAEDGSMWGPRHFALMFEVDASVPSPADLDLDSPDE